MRVLIGIVLLNLVYLGELHAKQLSVADVKAMHERVQTGNFSGRAEWHALGFYLQGVIEGFAAQHKALNSAGKSAAFCPPDGKGYSMEEFLRLLHQVDKEDEQLPAAEMLLKRYAELFPCN